MKIEWKAPKVNHFAAKTIDKHARISWEAIAGELLVTFLLLVFAYMGYAAKLALLLFPCAIGAVVVLAKLIFQLVSDHYYNRKSENAMKNNYAFRNNVRVNEMVTAEEVQAFFEQQFEGAKLKVESVGSKQAKLRMRVSKQDLRPGGTVSGPFMMACADAALYAAIFGELGITAMAVTTNMNINFLQKPVASSDLLAECSLLKVGKGLVVGEVSIFSDGNTDPVAHAVGTFSIPRSNV